MAMRKQYPFDLIEPKWQRHWAEHQTFAAKDPSLQDSKTPAPQKLYILDMFPYPSGAGLHVGHPLGYFATDIYSRYKRMRGFNVLHPLGWDAFGLPAEQYAIETGTHPTITTKKNIETYRRQIQMLGLGYDWSREVDTTDHDYFKWTQWIFLQLFENYYDGCEHKAMPVTNLAEAISGSSAGNQKLERNFFLSSKIIELSSHINLEGMTSEQAKRRVITNSRLAYEAENPVWWCDGCKAVLANEEVASDGTCERKGHKEVYRRPLRQWILKITAYAERLLKDLELVDWPESIKEQQRNWIGRSEGVDVKFRISNLERPITIFTTRPDTLYGATYMVLAPEHPFVEEITTHEQRKAVEAYRAECARKSELERTILAKEKTGVFTGGYAINPVSEEKIPIWIADYVMIGYGTGAIMAVPAHDQRDFEFAQQHSLPVKIVVNPLYRNLEGLKRDAQDWAVSCTEDASERELARKNLGFEKVFGRGEKLWQEIFDEEKGQLKFAYEGDGISVNSPNELDIIGREGAFCKINGLSTTEAKKKITAWLADRRLGQENVNYKLRDWLFSRQRYWGEPIPIVHCEKCGTVSIPENELPLRLPEMKDYSPSGTAEPPLAKATEWVNCKCPQCGAPAKRETNTMPQWAGSCWYYLRYIDPKNADAFCDKSKEKYFMPVDLYVGGAEHAVLHLLYSRFWHKVLFDLGHVSTPEPFMKLVNQGMILGEDGQKMSKSRGNVINPDDFVRDYGADTLRSFEMFLGPLDQLKPWSTRNVEGVYRFLGRVWRLFIDEESLRALEEGQILGKNPDELLASLKLSASIVDIEPTPAQKKLLHATIKAVTKDIEALSFNTCIARLMEFMNEATTWEKRPRAVLEPFVLLLSPFAPHLCEELWEKLGRAESLAHEPWPQYDESFLVEKTVTVVLQVNGKVREKVEVASGLGEEELKQLALANPKVLAMIEGKQVKKIIVVPNKLVNVVAA